MKPLLDPDRAREAQRQRRILVAAERRFAGSFGMVIRLASSQMLDSYEATGNIPPIPEDHYRRVEAQYLDLAGVMIEAFGQRILGQGKSLGYALERKEGFAEFFQRLAIEWVTGEYVRRRIASIAETTRRQIVTAIVAGQNEGFGVQEIAANIRQRVPAMSAYRGHMIARTETHGAANFGAFEAAKATRLPMVKEWIAVEDTRARDFGEADGIVDEYNHAAMNGQTVDMDQPFLMPWVGGEPVPCMFPGDPVLPAGASINCRCAVGYLVKGLDD